MSNRELVIEHLTSVMRDAFARGDLIDAQNIDIFLSNVEEMTDQEYEHFADSYEEASVA